MQQKVYFTNTKGDKLCGILSDPSNRKKPVFILCHGFSSSKESKTYPVLEEKLNSRGIATFRFDFYGHGESEGKFEDITVSEGVDDILQALACMKGKGYKKVGLVGTSYGGLCSIMAAAQSQDVFLLVLKCPVSDFYEVKLERDGKEFIKEAKQQGYFMYQTREGKRKVNYSFIEDFKHNNAYTAAKKITIPTLIVHGDKDETVPLEQSKKTASIIKDCKLVIVKGAGHRFYANQGYFNQMIDAITNFVFAHTS
jgi:uncharacterized protein